jgi:ABC-type methionine transport system ATPase subunit
MISKRIVLHFPARLVDKPIVYRLIKDFNLEFNILKAHVTPEEEGLMVLELRGEDKEYTKGLEYLRSSGLKIQPLSEDIVRNSAKCTDCGV